jgi:hypothetical protein
MRKITLALSLFLLSAWSFAQTAPAEAPPDGQSSAAPQAQGEHRHRGPGVAGTITAINPGSFTVKTMNGQTAEITLSDKTQFRKERQPAQLSDFKVGDQIFVRGQSAGENAWQAEIVAAAPPGGFAARMREGLGKEFIVGEIKAINGTQLTIQRPDGVSQTIAVDESTSFKKQGESVTLADFKAGDHVFGRGEVKNGVFVPSMLNLGDPMMWRGPGFQQGQGPGAGQGQGQGEGAAPAPQPN